MKTVVQIISWIALALTVVPSVLFLAGTMALENVKFAMLIAAVVWFVATPFWMDRKENA